MKTKFSMFQAGNLAVLLLLGSLSVFAQEEDYIYELTESKGSYTFWTAPPTVRVFQDDAPPADTGPA